MAIIGRHARVLYQVVSIDDQCDTCGARDVLGICYGPALPVICFECLRGGVMMADLWGAAPGTPRFSASEVRGFSRGGGIPS